MADDGRRERTTHAVTPTEAMRAPSDLATRRTRLAVLTSGREQHGAFSRHKPQGLRDEAHRCEVRCAPNPTLQVRDPAPAQAGSLGELLLCQPGQRAVLREQTPE
jgi:hypothetical protein